jgi:hypothetical protein
MAYRIAGKYIASCDCSLVCPCPVDGPPTGPNGECHGVAVFGISEGNSDGTDLSGVNWALYNLFPSNISSGSWKAGIVVDSGASDEQAQALERIVSGDEGGPFADFKPLIGEYLGMDRASVTLEGKRASVEGVGDFTFEPFTGPDGSETTVSKAMFGFAPQFTIGRSSGRTKTKVAEIDPVYGESADYEFSSEMGAEEIRPRA